MSRAEITRPPASLLSAIETVAAERFGVANLRGAALAQAVRRVSDAYCRLEGNPSSLATDAGAHCARLKFFLPRDFPKVQAPLRELLAVSALPKSKRLRVLDLGAGLGTTGLGAAAFLSAHAGIEHLHIDAVDNDGDALAVASLLCRHWTANAGLKIEYKTLQAALTPALFTRLSGSYDLIVLGFVLNELGETSDDAAAHHATWLERLCELLTEDGALIVLEPALRTHCRVLQTVRGMFASSGESPYVFAPCLHQEACPLLTRERDFCHQRLPLALPETLVPIAHAAGLRDADLSYSYLTLRRVPGSLAELRPPTPLHRVVSAPLGSKGKIEVGVCGPGGIEKLRRLDRHRSVLNQTLSEAQRGTVLALHDAASTSNAATLSITAQTRIETLLKVIDR